MQLNLYISPSAASATTRGGDIILGFLHSADIPLQILEDKKFFFFINSESLRSDCFTHLPLAGVFGYC